MTRRGTEGGRGKNPVADRVIGTPARIFRRRVAALPVAANDLSKWGPDSIILYCARCREAGFVVCWLNAYLVGGYTHIVCGNCETDLTFDIFPPEPNRA